MSAERKRSVGRALMVGVLAIGVVGLAFWAGRATLPQSAPEESAGAAVAATVAEQSVGRVLQVNVTVAQSRVPLAVNRLSGTVTSVGGSGTVKVGSVLYRVDRRPVVAVAGSMPFYRPLAQGNTGRDVRQLNDALVKLGYRTNSSDRYDTTTRLAVRKWQGDLSATVTGQIALGDLVAIPKLPAAVTIDRKMVRKGLSLAGGEQVISGRSGDPSFALVVGEEQAQLIPSTATVTLSYKGRSWKAVISDSSVTENGETRLDLTAPSGGVVCGKTCDALQTDSELYVPAEVTIIPSVKGPAVPVAAIVTNPDGTVKVQVVGADGSLTDRTVQVLGSQDGLAVVKGVEPGERVQVLAAPTPSPSR